MSLKVVLGVNYFAQIYSAVITLLVIPLFFSKLGGDGFGLFSFFLMLQAWFQVLDAGISGSVTRLVSISKNNRIAFLNASNTFMKIACVFLGVGLFVLFVLMNARGLISNEWLNSQLPLSELKSFLGMIFLSLIFRYFSGPFKGGMIGLEKHLLVASLNSVFVTLKFPGALIFLNYTSDLEWFFIYQGVVAFLELVLFCIAYVYSMQKIRKKFSGLDDGPASNSILSFKEVIRFSFQLALLSIVWVVVTQVDKLLLSRFLALSDYGEYSLAVSIASGVLLLSAPINQILMPRLSTYYSDQNKKEYLKLYLLASLGTAIVLGSVAAWMAFFSREVLWVWVGEEIVGSSAINYTPWLALGNLISVVMNLAFLLLYSSDGLKIHVRVYCLYAVFLVPATVYVTSEYGALGASIFWFFHNLFFYVSWGVYVQERIIPGINRIFFGQILFPVVAISCIFFGVISYSGILDVESRVLSGVLIACVGLSNVLILISYFWLMYRKSYVGVIATIEVKF